MLTRKVRVLLLLMLASSSTSILLFVSKYEWLWEGVGQYVTIVQEDHNSKTSFSRLEYYNSNSSSLLLSSPPLTKTGQYLSYQPPGNGWNNQRQALENAAVLARLLNRTLIVHPMSPHDEVRQMKQGVIPGYLIYNQLEAEDLLPLSMFLDMKKLGKVVSFIEYTGSHKEFLRDFGNKTWNNVCHSVGFGFWVQRHAKDSQEEELIKKQDYHLKPIWKKKCPAEQELYFSQSNKNPIIRYVEDLASDNNEMLYFEQGTLFGISIRFFDHRLALLAQQVIDEGIDYSLSVKQVGENVASILGGKYNAIHVRRTDHQDKSLPAQYWMDLLHRVNMSTDLPLYIATDEQRKDFFQDFINAGFSVHFYTDFLHLFDFGKIPQASQQDYIGIHEQYICQMAVKFVPSPNSSFSVYILRMRGDLIWKHGLMTQYTSALWMPNHVQGDVT